MFAALSLAAALAAAPARGQLVERVACRLSPAHSYALYVPAGEAPERGWPILYAFDSHGAGAGFAKLFVPAAERLRWVVASAYGSSNVVPIEQNIELARAMWTDAHERLALDDQRAYFAAFSGLSRFATTMALAAPGSLAGVIGLNGGFPLGETLTVPPPFAFFATVGELDFNYYELLDLEARLAAVGASRRLDLFGGSHEWPPPEVAGRGLEWMELLAMRRGARPVEEALVEALWSEGVARAEALEKAVRPWPAYRAWSALASDFAGLRAVSEAEAAKRRHESSPRFRAEHAARAARDRRDRAYLERAPRLLGAVPAERGPAATAAVLERLDIVDLKRRAAGDPDPDERLSAERLLYAAYIQAALYLPRQASERGQYETALFYLDIAAAIRPEVPHVHFRQAVAHAHLKNPRAALDSLRRAIDLGWDDLAAIDAEEAFAPLRDLSEMGQLRASLAAGR